MGIRLARSFANCASSGLTSCSSISGITAASCLDWPNACQLSLLFRTAPPQHVLVPPVHTAGKFTRLRRLLSPSPYRHRFPQLLGAIEFGNNLFRQVGIFQAADNFLPRHLSMSLAEGAGQQRFICWHG